MLALRRFPEETVSFPEGHLVGKPTPMTHMHTLSLRARCHMLAISPPSSVLGADGCDIALSEPDINHMFVCLYFDMHLLPCFTKLTICLIYLVFSPLMS